jgi:probable phosphoglycerate mutase
MVTTIYLIRHGATDWNEERRWQGHVDIPLNHRGRRQSELLARRLVKERVHFHYIYSSDLARAYQTAWEVGAAMNVPVELLPPLREIDMGEWSGLTRDEVRERYPVEFSLLEKGQDIPRGGKETLTAMRERVIKGIMAMVRQHPGETLAFFSHGGPIRMMLSYALQAPVEHAFQKSDQKSDDSSHPCKHIGNASITILHHSEPGDWQYVVCNDVSHLAGQEQAPDLMSAPPDDAERPVRG